MSAAVLGIDTSATVCAGVARAGEVVASATVADTRAHAERLMPLVQQVVAEAGLGDLAGYESIAVGVGPGPFTGLRVGVVAAITLGEALGIPVRGVCSLDVLAHQAVVAGLVGSEFVVATDARRKEWYWARYSVRGTGTGDSPSVSAQAAVPAFGGTVPMATLVHRVEGPFVTAPDELPDLPQVGPVTGTPLDLDAGVLAAIAADLPDAGLEPLYLRRPDAQVPTTRKSTLLPPRLAARRTR